MVDGKFYTDMDFTKFPFEKLDLNILVEPLYNYTNDGDSRNDIIQLHMWPFSGVATGAPSPGYEIVSYNITVGDNQYDVGDTYSRYDINFKVQRNILDSFLKFIFPVLVMVSLAFATLIYPSEQYMTKISLNALFLLGILLFVQSVQQKIPNIGEMTVFDYVVIISYAIIVVTIATPTIKWKIRRKYEENKMKRDVWKDRDRRNHDLNLENLRRTEADIIFFNNKLETHEKNSKEYNDTKDVLKNLNERRLCLDRLKNIDSKISLFLRTRADVKDEDIIRDKNLNPDEITPEKIREKVIDFLIGSNIERDTHTEKIRNNLDEFLQESQFYKNISTQEIGKEIIKILEEKEKEIHSKHEHEIIEQIIKPLKEYEKAKSHSIVLEKVQKRLLNRAWKKYGKIILKEEFLQKQAEGKWERYGKIILKEEFLQKQAETKLKKELSEKLEDALKKSAGTIHDLQILEVKRADVLKKLQFLEVVTEDNNEEMVINDERFLQTNIRETISKNELEELDRIKSDNKKYNRLAYVCIGGIVVTGLSIIGSVL